MVKFHIFCGNSQSDNFEERIGYLKCFNSSEISTKWSALLEEIVHMRLENEGFDEIVNFPFVKMIFAQFPNISQSKPGLLQAVAMMRERIVSGSERLAKTIIEGMQREDISPYLIIHQSDETLPILRYMGVG